MSSYLAPASKKALIIILTLLVLISAMFIGAPKGLAIGADGIVKVKISIGNPTTIPIFIDGNFSIVENNYVLPRQRYNLNVDGANLKLYYGTTLVYSGATMTLKQHTATQGRNNFVFLYNSEHGYRRYIGRLAFSISGGAISLINHLYMEDYVFGVVPYEMSNTWPVEALKAQAICARTYAARYISGDAYDVVDTTSNQVYKGYKEEYTNTLAAVTGTAKTVLKSGADYVQTFYAASNGGSIEIPQHVWSAGNTIMPYHVIHADPYDVANTWSKQEVIIFPKAVSETDVIEYQEMISGSMVTGAGPEAGNAERYFKIRALPAVAEQGYIAGVSGDIEIVGVNGISPHTFDPDDHHDILDYNGENKCIDFILADVNMTVLASKYINDPDSIMLGDINLDGRISITDYTLTRLDILGLKALTETEIIAADINKDGVISITDYTLIRLDILGLKEIPQDGSLIEEEVTVDFGIDMREFEDADGIYRAFKNFSLRLFAVVETDESWNIYQRRYGHGVGMSQRGAQQMANTINPDTGLNFTGAEILQFYYPNTAYEVLAIEKNPLSSISPPAESFNATIDCSDSMNVRGTASSASSANIVGRIPKGARVLVTQAFYTADWHQISYEHNDGSFESGFAYLHKDYVALG